MNQKVLVVDDDAGVREALAQTLELAELQPVLASAFIAAKDHISAEFDGVVLSDIRMPGRDGFHLLSHARAVDPDLPVILLTGEGDIPMAVRAMGEGAFGFLEKPCAPADMLAVLERGLKTRALVLENRRLKALVESGDAAARLIFGRSALAEGLRQHVRRVAQTKTEVLVTGPPGAGVSKVAEVIHLCSARAKAPFVKRAAAGLEPEALQEALQAARGGSFFLDEVTHLPAASQLELVDAGVEARLIVGTIRDLAANVEAGTFNADLYYRLDVSRIRIPALAERPEDIPLLFRHYVGQASEQAGLTPPPITPQVIADLMAREWPGNARSLMSEAMRFALQVEDREAPEGQGLAEQMARVERSFLIQALERTAGNATAAAEDLKLPRKTFYDKLARHALKPEDYRGEV